MYKFNKNVNSFTLCVMALSISACSINSSSNPQKVNKILKDENVSPTVVKANDYNHISIKTGGFNLGKVATTEEIAGWHIEVSHNHNLPPGQGTATDGEELFDELCASCHGSFGEGVGRNPVLAGGEGTLTDRMRPEKTVGSYWPYASTLLDYTHRAMPFNSAQSLSWDETWSLAAYVLYLNDVIEDDQFIFNAESYHEVTMPNEKGFIRDDRPDTHNTRCMKDCKEADNINVKTALLGYDSGAEDVTSKTIVVEGHELGQNIYDATCKLCHGNGLAGAPKIDDIITWENRLKQGLSKVHTHAIDGFQGQYGVMPPRGGNMELTDEEVKAAVDFMLKNIET
ncbi:MAG: c-type cytochrome [Alcanivoracaceae bacterium]|nr:c-type cytochrome [Alcanivoracaceae bacterium]